MITDTDSIAMDALQTGSNHALDGIMARWKGPIAGYLYKMLYNYHDAVELAGEVFIKVYFERAKFDTNKPFGPWLYTIAGNLAKNRLRWRFIHKTEAIDEALLPDDTKRSETGVLMECLQQLPTELREVVVLFDIEDYSHEEVAQIIGKGRKTVEARLYKARELLKKAYGATQMTEVALKM